MASRTNLYRLGRVPFSLLAGLLTAHLVQPTPAAAQALSSTPPVAPHVQIELLGLQIHLEVPDTRVFVYDIQTTRDFVETKEQHLKGTCEEDCQLFVSPGTYELRLEESDGRDSTRRIDIRKPRSISLSPPHRKAQHIGLAVAVGGTAIAAVGLGIMAWASVYDQQSSAEQTVARVGLATLLGGAIAASIGWATFASNRGLQLEERYPKTQNNALRVDVAVMPTHGGACLGISGSF